MLSRPLRDSDRGFTLIEVSIVLVIIGLVVGSVMAGKHLIRQSELQSIATDIRKYQASINTFYGKYGALPGDMPDATMYWGEVNSNPATCYVTQGTGTQTCNGNNDGKIDTPDGGTTSAERFRAWQHLSNAKMVDGMFTGVAGDGGKNEAFIGINIPGSKISASGYSFAYIGSTSGNANYFPRDYEHAFFFGAYWATTSTIAPILSPGEALSLDSKIDDGVPAFGYIMGWKPTPGNYNPSCTTSVTPSVAKYDISLSGPKCSMIFLLNF